MTSYEKQELRRKAEYLISRGYVLNLTEEQLIEKLALKEGISKLDEHGSKSGKDK